MPLRGRVEREGRSERGRIGPALVAFRFSHQYAAGRDLKPAPHEDPFLFDRKEGLGSASQVVGADGYAILER